MVRAVNDAKLGTDDVGTAPSTQALWDELGGYVYGLSTIFERAKERGFEPPDDTALEQQDRVAYLLHDEPRLPPATGDGSLDLSEGLRSFTPRGHGPGATY